MITNYVKVALRNLWHNKLFSGINLIGLSTGTLCCLYILLYVRDQRRFDQHFSDAERIYRVVTDLGMPDKAGMTHMASCSPPIPPAIKAEFPEVEYATRVCAMPGDLKNLIRVGDKSLYEKKGYLVDSTFFQVFDYPFVAGNPATALNEPHTVVIAALTVSFQSIRAAVVNPVRSLKSE
jgi:putative ABC transport system permease protein